ncbi:MAG: hypothetical protein J6Y19_09385, partial [Kiritimatiellae bacterium]|nr:hypothetical protein [Kiritimatiellia bacterium]
SRVEATATNSDGEAVRAHRGITVGAELSVVEPSGGGAGHERSVVHRRERERGSTRADCADGV